MNRSILYALTNLLFAVATVIGFAVHRDAAHPLYVILLFAICSSPIIAAEAINGRYALLILWSGFYFTMYGALDFQNLMLGVDGVAGVDGGPLDATELVILIGGVLVHVFYRLACRQTAASGMRARPPKDWPELTLVVVGVILWVASMRLNWEFSVDTFTDKTAAATQAGFESLGNVKVALIMIARMAAPLSIMILAYAQCRYRRAYMAPLVLGVVIFQLLFGFVIDTKGEAMIGGILVVLTNLLVNGRIPKGWMVITAVMVVLSFPVLQANRVVRDEHGFNSKKASENLALIFDEALRAEGRVNTGRDRAQTALERTTTKGSVEMIVRGMAANHPYQWGYTLSPIFTTFIPRLIWPGKPSIPTGQILNKEFHVSAVAETFISPSHIGELYWNFGWAGVVLGMSGLGYLFGFIGRRFDLAEAATITRLLVLVVTVRQVVLGSEGEFATQYIVWMRSLAGIGLLHLMFARVRLAAPADTVPRSAGMVEGGPPAITQRLFPNLLP
jgi:hypothetical protein